MAEPQSPNAILVTARSLQGEVVFGPQALLRDGFLQTLRSALLRPRHGGTPQRVSLFRGAAELQNDAACDGEAAIEVTAVFAALELTPEERSKCMLELSLHDWRAMFVTSLTDKEGFLAKFASLPEAARADKELVLKAVKWFPMCLEFAHIACQEDREIVLKAVEIDPRALRFAGDANQNDKEIVSLAVAKDPRALKFASAACRDDREIVLKAVGAEPRDSAIGCDACALAFAGAACKDDREIVLKAVEVDPQCLKFAGDACKNDSEIVSLAVAKDARVLEFAGAACKDGWNIVLKIVDAAPRCLHCASAACENDQEIGGCLKDDKEPLQVAATTSKFTKPPIQKRKHPGSVNLPEMFCVDEDYVSALDLYLSQNQRPRNGEALATYRSINESQNTYTMDVSIDAGKSWQRGSTQRSKKFAMQSAAFEALRSLH